MPALFLDRDGVINTDTGCATDRHNFSLMPGVAPVLRHIQGMGWRLVVVTNQSWIGHGHLSLQDYRDVTDHMRSLLSAEDVVLDDVLHAPYHPHAQIEAFRCESFWRKPAPGMILDAAQSLRIDLSRSAMVGDRARDVQSARQAGLAMSIFIASPLPETGMPDPDGPSYADHVIEHVRELPVLLRKASIPSLLGYMNAKGVGQRLPGLPI
ncbi:MAG: HAD family hydrolase [Alphaproteobacteria bacterium]|nr:MAG: HAD family hydrolase [Alphaproteobacteria bacterium]